MTGAPPPVRPPPQRERDLALYLRDAERGSCNVARGPALIQAFVAACGPAERLIACRRGESRALASAPYPRDADPPAG